MPSPSPSPESNGLCSAMSRQNESIVEMRSCAGWSSRFQPSACECTSARCASVSIENSSPSTGTECSAACSSFERMRCRISAAAALVNVMATISAGSSTSASKRRKRRVSKSVFPEPAGACTSMDFAGLSACARRAWSDGGAFAAGLLIGGRRFNAVFANCNAMCMDAANCLKPAAGAGVRILAWIDVGAAGKKITCQHFDFALPVVDRFVVQFVFDEAACAAERRIDGGACVPYESCKVQIAASHFGERQSAQSFVLLTCIRCIKRELHVIWSRGLPGFRRNVPGLVVAYEQGAV